MKVEDAMCQIHFNEFLGKLQKDFVSPFEKQFLYQLDLGCGYSYVSENSITSSNPPTYLAIEKAKFDELLPRVLKSVARDLNLLAVFFEKFGPHIVSGEEYADDQSYNGDDYFDEDKILKNKWPHEITEKEGEEVLVFSLRMLLLLSGKFRKVQRRVVEIQQDVWRGARSVQTYKILRSMNKLVPFLFSPNADQATAHLWEEIRGGFERLALACLKDKHIPMIRDPGKAHVLSGSTPSDVSFKYRHMDDYDESDEICVKGRMYVPPADFKLPRNPIKSMIRDEPRIGGKWKYTPALFQCLPVLDEHDCLGLTLDEKDDVFFENFELEQHRKKIFNICQVHDSSFDSKTTEERGTELRQSPDPSWLSASGDGRLGDRCIREKFAYEKKDLFYTLPQKVRDGIKSRIEQERVDDLQEMCMYDVLYYQGKLTDGQTIKAEAHRLLLKRAGWVSADGKTVQLPKKVKEDLRVLNRIKEVRKDFDAFKRKVIADEKAKKPTEFLEVLKKNEVEYAKESESIFDTWEIRHDGWRERYATSNENKNRARMENLVVKQDKLIDSQADTIKSQAKERDKQQVIIESQEKELNNLRQRLKAFEAPDADPENVVTTTTEQDEFGKKPSGSRSRSRHGTRSRRKSRSDSRNRPSRRSRRSDSRANRRRRSSRSDSRDRGKRLARQDSRSWGSDYDEVYYRRNERGRRQSELSILALNRRESSASSGSGRKQEE